ncbi:MarR family transcriptional regulator [Streptomyces sp. SID5785]|uniref:MarR family winged helix-turn-helix transcriptional regulator n=1 Tax=Streptomyces sp. SID5785 TaxID=2690309 RepID=UPI001360D3F1|nr:MarR family transcriptional regulator [Streptomyces sp. SID5785]MZD07968.1 MarR family transcriptional regulator [Streptomyces sp. SID5785]MZD08595.1 MarR family transcriptional regulator [Streptomyces sp. SID5785]
MGRPSHLVEFEHMVLGRHQMNMTAHREAGAMERSTYILLSRIQIEGPMSIGQLSEAFQLDASTLNRQTAQAVRAGLLERIADPEGGMARKFRLTGRGNRKLAEQRETQVGHLDRVFEDWPAGEVEAFADYLRRFNASIERLTGNPWPRS